MAQKKYTDGSGVSEIWLNIKNYITAQLLGKADSVHTHAKSDITDFPTLSTVATSGSYTDLSNKPTIPTVNNATLTIQKNSSNVATFTANASSNVTANISVPTKVSELTNDSGFITSSGSCNYANSAGAVAWDNVSGKPSTFTPSSHTHNYAGSSNAGGAASSTLKLETYKQGSTTETYGANYPIFAQWVDNNNVALKCTNYTVCVDKANSVAWGSVTGKPSTFTPSSHTHTKSQITDFPSLATVATSGSYNDLSNKPTIPTVNNATLTIQKNGTVVKTFTANASSDVTCNITVPTKVSELTNDSGFLTSADLLPLPIGSYIQFAGSQAPAGFLVCNGGAISRTTYSALFAVIGTTYGSGDGSTTFNLPNLTDRFLQGSTTSGTVINAGLPGITGALSLRPTTAAASGAIGGSFYDTGFDREAEGIAVSGSFGDIGQRSVEFSASLSSSIYGNSSTVQPPALTCLICIKY